MHQPTVLFRVKLLSLQMLVLLAILTGRLTAGELPEIVLWPQGMPEPIVPAGADLGEVMGVRFTMRRVVVALVVLLLLAGIAAAIASRMAKKAAESKERTSRRSRSSSRPVILPWSRPARCREIGRAHV